VSFEQLPSWATEYLDNGLAFLGVPSAIMEKNEPAVIGKTIDLEDIDKLEDDKTSIVVTITRVDTEDIDQHIEETLEKLGHDEALEKFKGDTE
jgi:hypothetical protein